MADRHGPMRTGRFSVEIDDVEVQGFRKVKIPSSSTEQGEYRDGDEPDHERKIWGETMFEDLELERGLPGHDSSRLYDWREEIRAGNLDEGRKEVAVVLMDEEGEPQIRWEFEGAWIKYYDPPTLYASSDGDAATETVAIAFDKMVREEQ